MTDTSAPAAESRSIVRDGFVPFVSGLAMGACNVIPGGDSGTIALIVGIYERLITAISRADATFAALVLKGRWGEAARRIDLAFVAPLVAGVACGFLVIGSLMHFLMERHYLTMIPIFFGMIAASCYLVAKLIKRWGFAEIALLIGGTVGAFWLFMQPALSNPPSELWYIFLCGFIGICALILPGISGAFLLLIMGKYHELTGVIHRAAKLDLTSNDFLILAAFGAGCAVGLVTCSKFLKWLLERHEAPTMALLCGIKIGSLWKIFPFQRDTTPDIAEFREEDFQPIPLNEIPIDSHFWKTIGLAVVAGVAILVLEYVALRRTKSGHILEQPQG